MIHEELILPYTPVLKAILLALIVVGPAEELGKYAVLRLITWNCPKCGTLCTYNFCGNCGTPKQPQQQG